MGYDCGKAPDGCGGVIDCGLCPAGSKCGNAGPNKCGAEAPSPPIRTSLPFEVPGLQRFELVGSPVLGQPPIFEGPSSAASAEPTTTQLETGAVYRGRAIVSYPSLIVTEGRVLSELAKYGITPARVWFDSDDLPADWPPNARSKENSFLTTQIYLEGTWTKPSGQYPTKGNGWGMFDHWLYKQPAKPASPPPPACRPIGAACAANSDCCTSLCSGGLCGSPAPNPVEVPTCASDGMPCDNLKCCEGQACGKDNGGYFKGGWCARAKRADAKLPKAKDSTPPNGSPNLGVATVAIVVGSVVVAAGAAGAAALAKALFARREVNDARRLLDRTGKPPQP